MNKTYKKPNRFLTIFGVIFIVTGFILAGVSNSNTESHESEVSQEAEATIPMTDEQKIADAIDSIVMNHLKADGYKIDAIQNNAGYDMRSRFQMRKISCNIRNGAGFSVRI